MFQLLVQHFFRRKIKSSTFQVDPTLEMSQVTHPAGAQTKDAGGAPLLKALAFDRTVGCNVAEL